MKEITKEEMYSINGGAINYTLLNALARLGAMIYQAGQAIGSAVRRMTSNNYC